MYFTQLVIKLNAEFFIYCEGFANLLGVTNRAKHLVI